MGHKLTGKIQVNDCEGHGWKAKAIHMQKTAKLAQPFVSYKRGILRSQYNFIKNNFAIKESSDSHDEPRQDHTHQSFA
jgi:hypothetical protein